MNPYDAVFFAVAAVLLVAPQVAEQDAAPADYPGVSPGNIAGLASGFGGLRRRIATFGVPMAPIIAWVCLPLGAYAAPIAALTSCAVGRRFFPAAVLLTVPRYGGLAEAVVCGVLWTVMYTLMCGLADRFDEVSPRLVGIPIRLVTLGILYYTLLPVRYL